MTSTFDRLGSALADRYRVDRELGAGGMATVYLAHDLRHERDVAIKVLHPDLGAALGAERFLSEIKTTAKLQHPHILPLLDSGAADGLLYYVMPYVRGETLRSRLEREKQLPIADAVRIAREVAGALDHAHKQGIIHRDIKPENILLQDGSALVADFGIALAVQQAGTQRLTQTGLSLGTPQYMSPEQAMGEKGIDARSDIYALGAVTYEMLVGDAPFTGSSVQAIVARILSERPTALATLRDTVPAAVEHAVLTALAKLPADRWPSAAAFADALMAPSATAAGANAPAGTRAARRRAPIMLALGAAIIAGAAFAGGRATRDAASSASPPAMQLSVELPDSLELVPVVGDRMALSPDGRQLALVGRIGTAAERAGIYVRRLNQLEARLVPGSRNGIAPRFSADGAKLAFVDRDSGFLTVADLAAGTVARVGDLHDRYATGNWGDGGRLYMGARGISRVDVSTGAVQALSIVDRTQEVITHEHPVPLPGARFIAFVRTRRPTVDLQRRDIALLEVATGKITLLTKGIGVRYADGILYVVRANGELAAAPFDPTKPTLAASMRVLATDVAVGDGGGIDLTVANNGTLLYVPRTAGDGTSQVVWVDRAGHITPVDSQWKGDIHSVALSPDGRRIAASIARGNREDVWVKTLGAPPVLLTVDSGLNRFVQWSADGSRVLYVDQSKAPFALLSKAADGTGTATTVVHEARSLSTGIMTPDGKRYLVRTSSAAPGNGDILVATVGDSAVTPLIATEEDERHPTVSSDGKWLAYKLGNSTGPGDLIVRSFPDISGGSWSIPRAATGGFDDPVFSRRTRELFFIDGAFRMSALEYSDGAGFQIGRITPLFTLPDDIRRNQSGQRFDVSPDGRFLMIRFVDELSPGHSRRRPPLRYVTGLGEQLRKASTQGTPQ
jgi:serine/threonine-protein kinase